MQEVVGRSCFRQDTAFGERVENMTNEKRENAVIDQSLKFSRIEKVDQSAALSYYRMNLFYRVLRFRMCKMMY